MFSLYNSEYFLNSYHCGVQRRYYQYDCQHLKHLLKISGKDRRGLQLVSMEMTSLRRCIYLDASSQVTNEKNNPYRKYTT